MDLSKSCVNCGGDNYRICSHYTTKSNGVRELYKCNDCQCYYAETANTFMFNIKTPISKIGTVLNARTEGMSFNATCRVHSISPHTLQSWEKRFGSLKEVLMAYTLSHSFLELIVEGDELYTKVGKNKLAQDSEGWTILLMDRASRFILELSCGEKEETLFMKAMQILVEIIKSTNDISLVTDGERRYSKCLFQICYDLIHNGSRGRPKKVLQENVRVRVKNKGSQAHKPGRKKAKYQTPKPEHPDTVQKLKNSDVHANHVEAQNSVMRRKNSAYRRKTNTYAKITSALQRTLDLYWVMHNFVRKHFTTKRVPAVKMGIMASALSLEDLIMNLRIVF